MVQHKMKKSDHRENSSAYAYYRCCCGSQSHSSVEQQRDLACSYAKEHDLQIVEEFMDIGVPGMTTDRPGFQRMMEEIGAAHPSTLLVYNRSRISRNIGEYIHALEAIEAANCRIVFTTETEADAEAPASKLRDLFLACEER